MRFPISRVAEAVIGLRAVLLKQSSGRSTIIECHSRVAFDHGQGIRVRHQFVSLGVEVAQLLIPHSSSAGSISAKCYLQGAAAESQNLTAKTECSSAEFLLTFSTSCLSTPCRISTCAACCFFSAALLPSCAPCSPLLLLQPGVSAFRNSLK